MAVAVLNPTQLLKPRAERVIAAIDVGSSKVAALVAMADGQDQPRVIGAGVRASNAGRWVVMVSPWVRVFSVR